MKQQETKGETIGETRLLSVVTGLFVATLIISNVASAGKIISLGPFNFPGGAILFPITFIFGDILTETYGFARTRKVIWTGFFGLVLASLTFWLVGILPGAPFWNDQETYDKILGFVPRLVLASVVAYFFGELVNSFVMSKMKYWSRGKRGASQAWRFVASTIVGEGVDSLLFTLIAFTGVMSLGQMVSVGGSLYLFKVAYEIAALPLSLPLANWFKRLEGVDKIDEPETTSYNPFVIFKA